MYSNGKRQIERSQFAGPDEANCYSVDLKQTKNKRVLRIYCKKQPKLQIVWEIQSISNARWYYQSKKQRNWRAQKQNF